MKRATPRFSAATGEAFSILDSLNLADASYGLKEPVGPRLGVAALAEVDVVLVAAGRAPVIEGVKKRAGAALVDQVLEMAVLLLQLDVAELDLIQHLDESGDQLAAKLMRALTSPFANTIPVSAQPRICACDGI